jgi:hypothetical protein
VDGRDTTDIKLSLRSRGINTSSPHREDAVIDMDEKGTASALRLSPHYYNTREEVDTAVSTLEEILQTWTHLFSTATAHACRFSPSRCSSLSTGSRTRHTVSAMRRCPCAVG